MNKLLHDLVNKFNNITVMCGGLALLLESQFAPAKQPFDLRERLEELDNALTENLGLSDQLIKEISTMAYEKLEYRKEGGPFFKEITSQLGTMKKKKRRLQQFARRKGTSLSKRVIAKLLHEIERSALDCAKVLKEFRSIARKKVLVVDDEKNLTTALQSFFKSQGHTIHIANSGKEALDLIRREKIDVLVLDLNMPGLDGIEVARTVKKKYADTKIVIITAFTDDYKERITQLGVEDVITKPFGILTLTNKVQSLLGEDSILDAVPEAEAHPRPVKVLFIDPAIRSVLDNYVLPHIRLSWGENIEVESISPRSAYLVREKIISFRPDIVLLSTVLTEQAKEFSKEISENIYKPKEVVLYNIPDEDIVKKSLANAYYVMQASLTDPGYLSRLNELIKEVALRHNLIDEEIFKKRRPGISERPDKRFNIDDVDAFVKRTILQELKCKDIELTYETSFVDDLGVDSLKTIQLTIALEETFGFEIPDDDIVRLRTVGAVIKYIKENINLEEFARRNRAVVKLLIVEDEKGICSYLENFFLAKGYDVISATEGRRALELAEKERPMIVLLDIRMPDMNGIEILKRMKEKDSSIKVVMVSVADEMTEEARRYGADDFITKPFSIRYLEDTVTEKIREVLSSF